MDLHFNIYNASPFPVSTTGFVAGNVFFRKRGASSPSMLSGTASLVAGLESFAYTKDAWITVRQPVSKDEAKVLQEYLQESQTIKLEPQLRVFVSSEEEARAGKEYVLDLPSFHWG